MRLCASDSERHDICKVVRAGCILRGPEESRLASQLLLAAALPDDDFTAFIAATSILIVNRLSGGWGEDDLYWNWDAFAAHFRLAEPAERAALMNGFRMMDAAGLVTLDTGPTEEDCLTRPMPEVVEALGQADPLDLTSAILADVTPREAGRIWQGNSRVPHSPPTLAAFRYLYERPVSLAPELPTMAPLIPLG